jgi:hypothetical protein
VLQLQKPQHSSAQEYLGFPLRRRNQKYLTLAEGTEMSVDRKERGIDAKHDE